MYYCAYTDAFLERGAWIWNFGRKRKQAWVKIIKKGNMKVQGINGYIKKCLRRKDQAKIQERRVEDPKWSKEMCLPHLKKTVV